MDSFSCPRDLTGESEKVTAESLVTVDSARCPRKVTGDLDLDFADKFLTVDSHASTERGHQYKLTVDAHELQQSACARRGERSSGKFL